MSDEIIKFEDLNLEYGESFFPGSAFSYTDEENKFRLEIRKFAKDEILPLAPKIEREPDLHKAFDLCIEAYRKLAKAGLLQLAFPKELGGQGKGYVYRTIFGEEIAAINSAVVVTYGASANLYAAPIIHFGTKDQQKRFLTPVMNGEKIGGIAITEPTAGSDAIGGMKTNAIKKGDKYVINGEKRFITNGSRADFLLLYALTDPESPKKHQAISAFIIDTSRPGFKRVRDYELCGRRGSINSHLKFENYEANADELVGGPEMENKGLKIMMNGLDGERVFAASQYIGIARSAFEVAAKYSNIRKQFGRKLRELEGISFKISEMYAKIEAMRLMILRAARMLDAGLDATKEVSAAKFTAANNQMDVILDAVQICGGIGYTKDFPVEQYLRDGKISQISAGTVQILKFLCQREIFKALGL